MTTIRPAGSAFAPAPVDLASAAEAVKPASGATPVTAAAPEGASRANPTRAVIADLESGRISPDAAVQRLTDLALDRALCTPAMRPAVEARIKATLARDPLVGALLRRMGATPTDE